MAGTAARHLYLARHGEALPDHSGLTENGRRQAVLLGERLRGVPLSVIHHSPLARAEQTARLVGEQLAGVPLRVEEAAGDYVPYVPRREELPADSADYLLDYVGKFADIDGGRGPALAQAALELFTGPVEGDEPRHELVVTHNFLIGWIVRAVQDAPAWRWLGLNHGNASLTVIRYAPGRPAGPLAWNDMRHLPEELRWTGFPPELRV